MRETPESEKVYRCEYCHRPVIQADIQQGGCLCGSRRLKVSTFLTAQELEDLQARGYVHNPDNWMDEGEAADVKRQWALQDQADLQKLVGTEHE